jgi:hypothetical protein
MRSWPFRPDFLQNHSEVRRAATGPLVWSGGLTQSGDIRAGKPGQDVKIECKRKPLVLNLGLMISGTLTINMV